MKPVFLISVNRSPVSKSTTIKINIKKNKFTSVVKFRGGGIGLEIVLADAKY